MGNNPSSSNYTQNLCSFQPPTAQRRNLTNLDFPNSNSAQPDHDFPKKSYSFIDRLPTQDKKLFRDEIANSYNEYFEVEPGVCSTTLKSKRSSTLKSCHVSQSQERRKSEDFDVGQIEENADLDKKYSNHSENAACIETSLLSHENLFKPPAKTGVMHPKSHSFAFTNSQASSIAYKTTFKVDFSTIGPHFASNDDKKLHEKDIDEEAELVLRTDTCERETENVCKDYKDLIDSPLCQVESVIGLEDEVRIDTISSPNQKASAPISPDITYIPDRLRANAHHRRNYHQINETTDYFHGDIGRPILIASIEEQNQKKDSDLMNLSRSETSNTNLSLLPEDHQSLSPEKTINKSKRSRERNDESYHEVEFSFKPNDLQKGSQRYNNGLITNKLKPQPKPSESDPISPDFFLSPSYTKQSTVKSKLSNTTSQRYDVAEQMDRIPELQLHSPTTIINPQSIQYKPIPARKPRNLQPKSGPLRPREAYLQNVTSPSGYHYPYYRRQQSPHNTTAPNTASYGTSQSKHNSSMIKAEPVSKFEDRLKSKRTSPYNNKENQAHPNLHNKTFTTPTLKKNNNNNSNLNTSLLQKNPKPLQRSNKPSITQTFGHNFSGTTAALTQQQPKKIHHQPSKSGSSMLGSIASSSNISRTQNWFTKGNSFSKEAGGSTASSIKASRDSEVLKKRTYHLMNQAKAAKMDNKTNGSQRNNTSDRTERPALKLANMTEDQYKGSFHIDDSASRQNKTEKTERIIPSSNLKYHKRAGTMIYNRTPTPTNLNEDIFNQTYRFKPSELSKNYGRMATPKNGNSFANSRNSLERKKTPNVKAKLNGTIVYGGGPSRGSPAAAHSRDEQIYTINLDGSTPRIAADRTTGLLKVNRAKKLSYDPTKINNTFLGLSNEKEDLSKTTPHYQSWLEKEEIVHNPPPPQQIYAPLVKEKTTELNSFDLSYTMDPPERRFSQPNSELIEQKIEEASRRSSFNHNPVDEEMEDFVELGESLEYTKTNDKIFGRRESGISDDGVNKIKEVY